MANHHIKLFVVDGKVDYIHHNLGSPSDDDPGVHASAPTGDKVRFKARDAGGFSVQFKAESPFESGAGAPGSAPISSPDGSLTDLETLKSIPTVKKKFPYTLTIAGLSDDPEIIIDNSGGGGPKAKKTAKKKK